MATPNLPYSFVLITILFVIVAIKPLQQGDCININTIRRSLNDNNNDPKLQDFLAWVARVDARAANQTSLSSDISDGIFRSNKVSMTLTVGKSGAQFSNVQDAVDYVPSGNNQRVVIQIAAGTYEEKVHVPSSKPYITFQGAGAGLTTITWHDTAAKVGSMPNSASVAIDANNFIARGITFANSSPSPPVGSKNGQAVALRISGDKAAFYNCNFIGYQDTLFDDQGRHYFESCFIQGSVDFICGNGQSYYKGCELHAIKRSTESLTAQRRSSPNENTGYSFVNCKVTGEGMAYLGRAWGIYSRVVFAMTYMEDIILASGWNDFGNSDSHSKVLYGQYKCTGPGAAEGGRVSWSHELTDAQAAPFLTTSFIDASSWLE